MITDVVFDILYEEDKGSVLHLSLKDRHILLKSIVKPCHPYIVCILPGMLLDPANMFPSIFSPVDYLQVFARIHSASVVSMSMWSMCDWLSRGKNVDALDILLVM